MTIRQLLRLGADNLTAKKIASAHLDAEVILSFIIKKSREYLFTNPEKTIAESIVRRFNSFITKRASGCPTAYLIGSKEFYGFNFQVNKNVLVPRPETEHLVEETLKIIKGDSDCSVAEIGTGSGCVAVTLAKNGVKKIYATDLSAPALNMAKKNARLHKVTGKIHFYRGDLLLPISNKKIDVLIANLPYGWHAWENDCSMETRGLRFEPAMALFTDEYGLKLYRRLLEQVTTLRYKPKYILFEIDPRQKLKINKLARKILPGYTVNFKKDYGNRTRLLLLKYF